MDRLSYEPLSLQNLVIEKYFLNVGGQPQISLGPKGARALKDSSFLRHILFQKSLKMTDKQYIIQRLKNT
jgi:hypothetical protein